MFEQPVITITCAFTRRWAIERWLDDLDHVRHDPKKTNLAIVVDTDEPFIVHKFKQFAQQRGYRLLYKMNDTHFPNEVRLGMRQERIANVKQQTKFMVNDLGADYVIGLEDDTVFPNLNIERLLRPLMETDQVGFVEGVEAGRHGASMVGVWQADDPRNPQVLRTLRPPSFGEDAPGYQKISAGGFYGYATRKSLYLQHDYYSSPSQPWGPDVNFGLWVSAQGFECWVDWSQVFGHNDHNKFIYPDERTGYVSFNKSATSGQWERTDVA